MNKELLLISRHLSPVLSHLESELTVHKLWEAEDPQAFLKEFGGGIPALVTDAFTPVGADLMSALPDLKLVANFGVGYDNVDVEYATAHSIKVTNTPGVLNDDTADLALGLMLAVFRRIPQADRFAREGRWLEGLFPLSTKLSGKRLGILGLGRIGKAVARRAEGFDMEISYHGRHRQTDQTYAYFSSPVELAEHADVLVVLVPETRETIGLVNGELLEALGPDGYLINVARGAIVDQKALVSALQRGRLGGAGLDVFTDEPHIPPELMAMDNVVLQPHVASGTVETRQAMGMLVVNNLLAFFRGKPLITPVN